VYPPPANESVRRFGRLPDSHCSEERLSRASTPLARLRRNASRSASTINGYQMRKWCEAPIRLRRAFEASAQRASTPPGDNTGVDLDMVRSPARRGEGGVGELANAMRFAVPTV